MNKIFFLSHSNVDSIIVQRVAASLGKDRCWIYEWDIKPGDSIFNFDKGISDSRIFVLFWSASASRSQPVSDEISQARIRIYRDRGFRLVIVKLDNTPLPLWLEYRSYIDGINGSTTIVKGLRNLYDDLVPGGTFTGTVILRDSFQNRQSELDKLEDSALSGNSPIILLGLDGMGKTSLMKKAESSVFSHLNPLWVDLNINTTPSMLLAAIARPLSIQIDPHEAATKSQILWSEKLFPEIKDSKNLYIVFDNLLIPSIAGHTRSESTSRLIELICHDLVAINKPNNPGLVLISWTMPLFDNEILAKFHQIGIGRMENKYMARALRYHLTQNSPLEYDLGKLESLSQELEGYPAALEVIAQRIIQQGIDATIADKKSLKTLRYSIAEELFSRIQLSSIERQVIVTIASSNYPLLDRHISMLFKQNPDIMKNIRKNQLLDPVSSGYSIHSILRDYVLETIASPTDIKQSHTVLAQMFQNEWNKSLPFSADRAQYASLSHFHALASGALRWAKLIQIDYLEEAKAAAIELYRRGQYDEALSYLERVRQMGGEQDPIFDFYYGLSLNRLSRSEEARQIIEDLVNRFPKVSRYYNALGTIQKNLGDKEKAIESYRKAISLAYGSGKVTSLCSLSEILTEIGRAKEAIPLVEQALTLEPADSFVVATASMVYDSVGQTNEALHIIVEGLRISPRDTRLHHRAGMLLKKLGLFTDAKDHLEQASVNPALSFSITALADVYLELNRVEEADQVLERFSGSKQRSPSYLVTKGNILRRKGDFSAAETLLKKALRLQPKEIINLGGLAQLKYDQAVYYLKKGDKQSSLICIEEARNVITDGLNIDQNSEVMLSLQHMIETLERQIKT
jgi:tetratricopeptide (TPR) repeat protein